MLTLFQIVINWICCDWSAFEFLQGAKRPWSRLGRTHGRVGPVLSASQKESILSACVMYQIMLELFSQIRLDILTGLSYFLLPLDVGVAVLVCLRSLLL